METQQSMSEQLRAAAEGSGELTNELALAILRDENLSLEEILAAAEIPRRKYFENKVRIHVLNNIRNGFCPEDCGYCAQRKTAPADSIADYPSKSEAEIMEEARIASESGAYRYCLVTAGRGPSRQYTERLAGTIKRIKEEYNLEVCLSAGILKDQGSAEILAEAGLDRYNHNLNTSDAHYGEICDSHTFKDRTDTLETMSGAGVSLCSGVIAGMGESSEDLVQVATRLRDLGVVSIPVNFFIPVEGHGLGDVGTLTTEDCLRILAMFRLVNPTAEIRMAAGRELYLKGRQEDGLRAANSLFVSGYLNVKGSNARQTIEMMLAGGYLPDVENSDLDLKDFEAPGEPVSVGSAPAGDISMKTMDDLRPFRKA